MGKIGPPVANMNGLKNGSRVGSKHRLIIGKLPKEMQSVVQRACRYRRDIEAATMDSHAGIDIEASHTIDLATQCEMQAAIMRWVLRERLDKLTVSDIVQIAESMTKAKKTRNTAVKALKLRAGGRDALDDIYTIQIAEGPETAAQETEGANGQTDSVGPATRVG